MDVFSSPDRDPYCIIDPVLMPWAGRNGVRVAKIDRDWYVRSVWLYDQAGNRRAQMWFQLPDSDGNVTVVASALDPSSPTKWGAREERHSSLETLEKVLEELWPIMRAWGGPGAFS
jgi:hypothetical protein